MTLRLHHYLAILPLFILLGVANALLSAWLDTREVTASLKEEVRTLAVIEDQWPAHLPTPADISAPAASNQQAILEKLEQTLWQRGILFVLAGLVAGIFVAEILTRLNLKELSRLQQAADHLAEGRTKTRPPPGHIREYDDLGGTLGTLEQILEENNQHTRSRLLHHDRKS